MVDVRAMVRKHILEHHFVGAQDYALRDDEPLISGGIIDSVSVIELIHFIEEEFDIEFMPREVDLDQFDTLERIDRVVRSKLGTRAPNEKA